MHPTAVHYRAITLVSYYRKRLVHLICAHNGVAADGNAAAANKRLGAFAFIGTVS